MKQTTVAKVKKGPRCMVYMQCMIKARALWATTQRGSIRWGSPEIKRNYFTVESYFFVNAIWEYISMLNYLFKRGLIIYCLIYWIAFVNWSLGPHIICSPGTYKIIIRSCVRNMMIFTPVPLSLSYSRLLPDPSY